MAHLPEAVKSTPLEILDLISCGKVRDQYGLDNEGVNNLFYTSNRASIFDFVLPFLIPFKGEVLNAINVFMAMNVFKGICEQDIVAYGADIDKYLPMKMRNNPELHKVATVVRNLPAPDFEGIGRNYLLGSSVEPYNKNGIVSGHRLPAGLKEGDELPYALFTPSNKAETGHDEHISFLDVEKKYGGQPERLILQLMSAGRKYFHSVGLDIADTKFEMSLLDDVFYLIDERLTPDSSRFWDLRALAAARAKGVLPPSLDKQYLRNWGKSVGLASKDLDPEDPKALAFVAGLPAPNDVITMTSQIYRYIAWRIFGQKLELFQRDFMNIEVKPKPVNIDIILGSRSDLGQTEEGLELLKKSPLVGRARVHIISCHRNPEELDNYTASDDITDVDVIVAGAGLAAALPGMTKALLRKNLSGHIPVIGVGFEGSSVEADEAAMLSIEQLPGKPVELNSDGEAHFGPIGFYEAVESAINDEFLPNNPGSKDAEFNIDF